MLVRVGLRPVIRPGVIAKSSLLSCKRTFISPVEIIDHMTTALQTFHATSGIPWWALIPLTTITFRTVITLPLAILQRKRAQKQAGLRPVVNAMGPILRLKLAAKAQAAQIAEAKAAANSRFKLPSSASSSLNYEKIMVLSVKEVRKRQKKLFKEHGCEMYKNFLLPAVQIPLWVAMSYTFRNLSGWTEVVAKPLDPTLTHEGIFWFQDLSVMDPTGIMPIMLGSMALLNVEWNYRTMEIQNLAGAKRSLRPTAFDALLSVSRIGVVFLMAICTQAPTALGLYWISSNAFSGVQNMVLDYYLPIRYNSEDRFSPKKAKVDTIPLFTRNIKE